MIAPGALASATTKESWCTRATSAGASCTHILLENAVLGFQRLRASRQVLVVMHGRELQMAANKKPRKKYKPRFPQGKVVLPSLVRYSANDDFKLKFIPHQELERFRDGTADESSWHTVTVRGIVTGKQIGRAHV